MARSMCDYVLLTATKEDFLSLEQADEEIAAHLEVCSACAETLARKAAVQTLVEKVRMDPIAARRMTVRVLASNRKRVGAPRRRRVPRLVWTSLLGAGAAVLGFLLVGLLLGGRGKDAGTPTGNSAQVIASDEAPSKGKSPKVNADDSPEIREAMSGNSPASPEQPIVATATDRTVDLAQGTTVWVKADSEVSILRDSAKRIETRVTRGRIIVDIPRRVPGFQFIVHTPRAEVASLGTVFSVEVKSDGEEIVRVSKSAVVVRPVGGLEPVVVRAGEELSLAVAKPAVVYAIDISSDLCHLKGTCGAVAQGGGRKRDAMPSVAVADAPEPMAMQQTAPAAVIDSETRPPTTGGGATSTRAPYWAASSASTPSAPDPSPSKVETPAAHGSTADAAGRDERLTQLLQLAAEYRNGRQLKQAVAVYKRIFREFPDSDAAINGLVSVAQIQQGMLGDAADALGHYDVYLKKRPHGSLAEAASAGRVRALFTLKRWKDVVEACDTYMRLFAGGLSEREVLQKRRRASEALAE